MTLGALVDLGVSIDALREGLARLSIGRFDLRAERIRRAGLMGTQVHVDVEEEPHRHRHLHHIYEIVEAAGLPPRVEERARRAYRKLAEAEAEVHGSTPERIHFHEVGAKDAIVDVAGAMLGIELLGVRTFSASPLTVGFGTVTCQHGRMPVPAPATAVLLRGVPTVPGPVEGEMVTPTGAAILATLLEEEGGLGFIGAGSPVRLVAARHGYGAGTRTYEGFANYLRLVLCESPNTGAGTELPLATETIALLECEVDDMTPQAAGYLLDRLLDQGALDAHWQPVQMKKNRPALHLRVLARPQDEARLAELIFRESTTLGLRRRHVDRWTLGRRQETVETDLGSVPVKLALWADEVLRVTPEHDALVALARCHGLPLAEVTARVQAAIRRHVHMAGA